MTDNQDQRDKNQREMTKRDLLAAMTGLAAAGFTGVYLRDKSRDVLSYPAPTSGIRDQVSWEPVTGTEVTYIEKDNESILPFTHPTKTELLIRDEEKEVFIEDHNNDGRVDELLVVEQEETGEVEHYVKRDFPFPGLEYDKLTADGSSYSQEEAENVISKYDKVLQAALKAQKTGADLQGVARYLS